MTPDSTIDAGEASRFGEVSRRYAWVVFALTFGLLLSDYMSRQVLNAVFPLLKADWRLTDTQLGSLGGAVALMVGLLTLPLSLLADRWGRVRSLALMAGLWSLATLGCGLARSYEQMFAARLCVGVGEAAYGSVGLAVALSVFPPSMRATITGAFMAGGVFGSVLGMSIGGSIAQHFGWRWGFADIALIGLALGAVFPLIVREQRTPKARPGRAALPARAELAALASELFGSRALAFTYVASGLQLLVMGAMVGWMPSFLNREYGLSTGKAAAGAAVFVLIGAVGMIVCGRVADRLGRRDGTLKPALAALYCVATFGLLGLAFWAPHGPVQLALIGLGMFCAAGSTGPAGAITADLTRVGVHGTAFAVLTLINNLLGLAPGPVLAGVIADHAGLLTAFRVIPLISAASAAVFWLARRHYATDLAARTRAVSLAVGGGR